MNKESFVSPLFLIHSLFYSSSIFKEIIEYTQELLQIDAFDNVPF